MQDRLFENFKMYYPTFAKNTVEWRKESPFDLIATLSDGSTILYDDLDNVFRTLPDSTDRLTEEECTREFSMRLRKIMWRKGVSQLDLSEGTGISQPVISRYVTNKAMPGLYNLDRIARYLDVSVDEFRYT